MNVQFAAPLPFIFNKTLTSGTLENRNGSWVIVSGDFCQTIKDSQYKEVLASNILTSDADDTSAKIEKEKADIEAAEKLAAEQKHAQELSDANLAQADLDEKNRIAKEKEEADLAAVQAQEEAIRLANEKEGKSEGKINDIKDEDVNVSDS